MRDRAVSHGVSRRLPDTSLWAAAPEQLAEAHSKTATIETHALALPRATQPNMQLASVLKLNASNQPYLEGGHEQRVCLGEAQKGSLGRHLLSQLVQGKQLLPPVFKICSGMVCVSRCACLGFAMFMCQILSKSTSRASNS